MDKSWIPSGCDPETAFRIEVKIEGFFMKQIDGRKDYVKGKTLKWVVDSDRFSLCDLRSDLFDDLCWGSCQTPKIWMFDKNDGREVEVVSESQIPEMFRMFQNERKISLLTVICDLDGSSKCSGTNFTYPCTPSQPSPTIALGSQSHIGSSQGCNMSGQPDQSDNLDEYVGFNEESLYSSDIEGDLAHEGANHAIDGVHIDPEEDNVDEEPTVEAEAIEDNVHEEPAVDDVVQCEPIIGFDPEKARIDVNALFPDVNAFRKALRHFAIKNEFEVHTLKSDKKRFIGRCKHPDCPWRIRASILQDNKTFMVKLLPDEHTCPSTTMVDGKMASKSWVSDRVGDWLRKHPSAGAKEVKNKLEDEFHVKVTYRKAWLGRQGAIDQIHGKWEESFQLLYNFKAELEKRCPGSIVEVDCKSDGNKMFFSKIFVALKPCIDGFVQGCRPYLGVDSTHLTGKWKGQLAAAAGIDGHNWLFPVAYAVFDTETTENWTWFMSQLRNAIGTLPGLAISSDACKGLAATIATVPW
ncbi:uncharacterized protein LOC144548368 [Carex rostrata]